VPACSSLIKCPQRRGCWHRRSPGLCAPLTTTCGRGAGQAGSTYQVETIEFRLSGQAGAIEGDHGEPGVAAGLSAMAPGQPAEPRSPEPSAAFHPPAAGCRRSAQPAQTVLVAISQADCAQTDENLLRWIRREQQAPVRKIVPARAKPPEEGACVSSNSCIREARSSRRWQLFLRERKESTATLQARVGGGALQHTGACRLGWDSSREQGLARTPTLG